jgi:23S rRNA pseudouridine1911/1915/1917 synthase
VGLEFHKSAYFCAMSIWKIHVTKLSDSFRIIDYLLVHACSVYPSRSSLKKAFKKEFILLNGTVAQGGEWVREGDFIEIKDKPLVAGKVFPLVLKVLYEDAFMAVVVKPSGYPVSGNYYKTIQNALSYNLQRSEEKDALAILRPVHRLDKLTSGILLIAKTRRAQQVLGKQFEDQSINKTYGAVVKGKIQGEGVIDTVIEGQRACSKYQSLRVEKSLSYGWISYVNLFPKTGRTHQLRIHMSEIGHPIVGDDIHDSKNVLKGKGLFLCAKQINFKHPVGFQQLNFEIDLPGKYESLFDRELRRWQKFNH